MARSARNIPERQVIQYDEVQVLGGLHSAVSVLESLGLDTSSEVTAMTGRLVRVHNVGIDGGITSQPDVPGYIPINYLDNLQFTPSDDEHRVQPGHVGSIAVPLDRTLEDTYQNTDRIEQFPIFDSDFMMGQWDAQARAREMAANNEFNPEADLEAFILIFRMEEKKWVLRTRLKSNDPHHRTAALDAKFKIEQKIPGSDPAQYEEHEVEIDGLLETVAQGPAQEFIRQKGGENNVRRILDELINSLGRHLYPGSKYNMFEDDQVHEEIKQLAEKYLSLASSAPLTLSAPVIAWQRMTSIKKERLEKTVAKTLTPAEDWKMGVTMDSIRSEVIEALMASMIEPHYIQLLSSMMGKKINTIRWGARLITPLDYEVVRGQAMDKNSVCHSAATEEYERLTKLFRGGPVTRSVLTVDQTHGNTLSRFMTYKTAAGQPEKTEGPFAYVSGLNPTMEVHMPFGATRSEIIESFKDPKIPNKVAGIIGVIAVSCDEGGMVNPSGESALYMFYDASVGHARIGQNALKYFAEHQEALSSHGSDPIKPPTFDQLLENFDPDDQTLTTMRTQDGGETIGAAARTRIGEGMEVIYSPAESRHRVLETRFDGSRLHRSRELRQNEKIRAGIYISPADQPMVHFKEDFDETIFTVMTNFRRTHRVKRTTFVSAEEKKRPVNTPSNRLGWRWTRKS